MAINRWVNNFLTICAAVSPSGGQPSHNYSPARAGLKFPPDCWLHANILSQAGTLGWTGAGIMGILLCAIKLHNNNNNK